MPLAEACLVARNEKGKLAAAIGWVLGIPVIADVSNLSCFGVLCTLFTAHGPKFIF